MADRAGWIDGGNARRLAEAGFAAAVRALVGRVEAALGPVDVLVDNAVRGGAPQAPIEEQRWDDDLADLEAPLLLLQAVLPGMEGRGWGRVVDLGGGDNAHHVPAKAAIVGLTRSWATELGPWGVTMNSVVPGWTPRDGVGLDGGARRRRAPLGRVGTPDDVGAAVAHLCGEPGGFVTGQRLSVDGGMTRI